MELKNKYETWYQSLLTATNNPAEMLPPWYQMVLQHISGLEGKYVLEVASGKGEIAEYLHKNSEVLVSCDISFTACRYLKTKLLEKKLTPNIVLCDINNLPFKKGIFNIIVSCETLEHVENPEIGIQELIRVSTEDAYFYITTPNYFNIFGLYRIYLWLRGREFNSSGIPQPVEKFFLFFTIPRILKKLKLNVIKTDGVCFHLILLPRINPSKLRIKFFDKLYWLRQVLKPFALHRLVIARKKNESVGG